MIEPASEALRPLMSIRRPLLTNDGPVTRPRACGLGVRAGGKQQGLQSGNSAIAQQTDMAAGVRSSQRGPLPLSALVFGSVYTGGNSRGQKHENLPVTPHRREWRMGSNLLKARWSGWVNPKSLPRCYCYRFQKRKQSCRIFGLTNTISIAEPN